MPKILYIITQSETGGAAKNMLDLARCFAPDYDVFVAAGTACVKVPADKHEDKDIFSDLEKLDLPYRKLRWLGRQVNPFRDFMAFFEIWKLIKKEKPDIIHLHSSKAGVLGSLAGWLTGKKVVYTVHGAVFTAAFPAVQRRLFLWIERLTSAFKDKIICVSKNDKNLWAKYKAAPEDKLVVIQNGIDLDRRIPEKDEARECLFGVSAPLFEAAKGSGPRLKIAGTIANFYPEKGLTCLVQAADQILKEKDNLIFVVIGDGLQRPLLEEMISARHLQKKFVLAGRIKNASKIMRAFDVFVLPSVKEGFPYALLEAMLAGVPIVATHTGGIPEIVENGKTGLLALPKNPDGLARKISDLLDNPNFARQFAANGRQKIKDFSLEKMITETEKIYQS